MKNYYTKNIRQWLLLLVCIVCTLPSWAKEYTKDGIIYDLDTSSNTAKVKGVKSYIFIKIKIANIENRVEGCDVTSIENGAFSGYTSLTSINIPNSVTNIGKNAFFSCTSLTSINIPNSVTSIGENAFNDCTSLTSINIPNSVTSIGRDAFGDCSAVTSFIVDATNPNYCAEGLMLFNKDKTKLIQAVGNSTTYNIPNSVTNIEDAAFLNSHSRSSLTSINIPNSVTSIGQKAFYGCNSLTSINIPNSVTSIGDEAFCGTSLTSINIPSVTSIGYNTFYHCTSLTSINIPSVTNIGDNAFYYCPSLTSINIPSVTNIGGNAFYYCSSLTSINIPNSVTSIGGGAFEGCSSLTSINIPNTVNNIEWDVFKGCSSLTSINIPNSVTSIGGGAFEGCSSLTSINIPNSVTNIGNSAFDGCSSLTSINIPNSVTNIGYRAFQGCTSLTSINIPNSVNNIEGYAFSSCSSLTSINIPNTVNNIEWGVFKGCSSLTSINIPNSVNNIRDYAFSGCSSLTSINIPNSVTNIGDEAFYGCSSLTSIDIPKSVTSIGQEAFYDCSKFSYILFEGKECPSMGKNAFYHINSEAVIFVPIGSRASYEAAFSGYYIIEEGREKKLLDELIASVTQEVAKYSEFYNGVNPGDRHIYEAQLTNAQNISTNSTDELELETAYKNLDRAYQPIHNALLNTKDIMANYPYYVNLLKLYYQATDAPILSSATNKPNYAANDGLIKSASQLSTNAQEPTEGSLAALIDNDSETYFHSSRTNDPTNGAFHYLQIDLSDAYSQILLKFSRRRESGFGHPKTLHIYATNTVNDDSSWKDLGTKTCIYDDDSYNGTGILPLNFGSKYRYIRLVVEKDPHFFYWSELHAYDSFIPDTDTEATNALSSAITQAKTEIDASMATEATYNALKTAYENVQEQVQKFSIIDFCKGEFLTYFSDKAIVVPTGVKAGIVVDNGKGSIHTNYCYEAGDVIPANTGVLFTSDKGNSFLLNEGEATEIVPEGNLLHGTLNDEMTNVEGADKYYKLSYDRATGTELGFYWGAENGGAFVNKGGKAFLALPATLNAAQLNGFSLFDLDNNGAITGSQQTLIEPTANGFKAYDLNGRRVNAQSAAELSKGIYIVNGKKVIIK